MYFFLDVYLLVLSFLYIYSLRLLISSVLYIFFLVYVYLFYVDVFFPSLGVPTGVLPPILPIPKAPGTLLSTGRPTTGADSAPTASFRRHDPSSVVPPSPSSSAVPSSPSSCSERLDRSLDCFCSFIYFVVFIVVLCLLIYCLFFFVSFLCYGFIFKKKIT